MTHVDGMHDLLVLGTDGFLHQVTIAGEAVDDRPIARPADGRRIAAPVLGPDASWVAWSEHDELEGVVKVVTVAGRELLAELAGFVAFCLDPSPCGRRLAALANGPLGLELSVIDLRTGASELVSRGAPLYWAWSPDGERLAVHVDRSLLVHAIGSAEPQPLATDLKPFLAPWWSPAGGEVVYVDAAGSLVARPPDADTDSSTIAGPQSGFRFAVSPGGERVAYIGHHEALGHAVVYVHDRLLDERETAIDEPVAGMWWSPDGRRLLALVGAGDGPNVHVRWAVWEGGDTTLLPPFRPSPLLARSILPFFEQFAPAHRFWSHDGTAVVAAGAMGTGQTEVLVQHLDRAEPPARVMDAELAWFSPVAVRRS